MTGVQVHDAAESVLRFWLDETPEEKRFVRDAALDAEIARRFGALRRSVLGEDAGSWRAAPRPLLAAVILIDQFGRNLHRDDAAAYAGDPLARALAREALARGWQAGMAAEERRFLFMPFMHSEALADQLLSLRLFDNDAWSEGHARQIARFGRFPQRNAPLGRASSQAERAFLEEPGNRF